MLEVPAAVGDSATVDSTNVGTAAACRLLSASEGNASDTNASIEVGAAVVDSMIVDDTKVESSAVSSLPPGSVCDVDAL